MEEIQKKRGDSQYEEESNEGGLMKIWSVLAVVLVLVLAACQVTKVADNATGAPTGGVTLCPPEGNPNDPNCLPATPTENKTPIVTEVNLSQPSAEPQNEPKNAAFTITGVEGDLLAIKPNAYSPDNAKLSFSFSKPFNENGLWQTKDGDAGKYLITITASDGLLSTSESVLVVVKPSNKAPVVECPTDINVKEGEDVAIKCNIFDPEGDDIIVDYSGWMTSAKYTTKFGDAGIHTVIVRAADPTHITTKYVNVNVEKVFRAPSFDTKFKDMTASEGDVVTITTAASDPDNNPITITYSTPFDEKGVWKTKIGDAGSYPVTVVATNGKLSTTATFTLKVLPVNTAPVLKPIGNITVNEGDTITIPVDAYDREGDPLVVTFSGFMSKATYVTNYDDAYPKGCGYRGCLAHYVVTVSVSDGSLQTSQDVDVFVQDKPRSPLFIKE